MIKQLSQLVFKVPFGNPQTKLTLAVGSIVRDEGGHVVGGGVAGQAGAVVTAKGVVTGGVLPTDPMGPDLTLIFV